MQDSLLQRKTDRLAGASLGCRGDRLAIPSESTLPMNRVLIVSNPQDQTAKRIAERLRLLGTAVTELWPEQSGDELRVNLSICDNNPVLTVELSSGDIVDLNQFDSIWYRRPRLPALPTLPQDEDSREFAQDEWQSLWHSAYCLARPRLWVSHPEKLRMADSKPLQAKLAVEEGLSIPDTLITTDAKQLREFSHRHGGRIIVKATGCGWVQRKGQDAFTFILTNRVRPEDLNDDAAIRLAPITAQEELRKRYEIRVNVVGREVLAIRIDSQRSQISELDWRRYDVANTPYTRYTLPIEVADACRRVTRRLGLNFGAIDIVRTLEGSYVFLEINGNGQFLWAEELSGVPVSDAMTRLLAGTSEPLVSALTCQ